ncbi:hypothetical protein J520_2225 [Acinetobacter sp. 869535]|nr:hypothetical protein J520_2225 [Acinetobacter sp. 869535]
MYLFAEDFFVHCHIGSLEMFMVERTGATKVHCHIGSLEK